jgi:hypothetical protein
VVPFEVEGLIVCIGPFDELLIVEMRFAETEEDIVDDVQSDLKVALVLPLDDEETEDLFDIGPVLQNILRMVLEDALEKTSIPFQGLFVPSM